MKNKNLYTKLFVLVYGTLATTYFAFITFHTFLTAYFGETKSVIIYVNRYGEANIEFVMMLILIPLVCYCTIKQLILLRREFNVAKKEKIN